MNGVRYWLALLVLMFMPGLVGQANTGWRKGSETTLPCRERTVLPSAR
jgi:hypothetical protein